MIMNMVPIVSYTEQVGATNIIFNGIPQNFKHLYVVCSLRVRGSNAARTGRMSPTIGTGSVYVSAWEGNGASISTNFINNTDTYAPPNAGSGQASQVYTTYIAEILEYTDTTKSQKMFKMIGGYDANGSGVLALATEIVVMTGPVLNLSFGTQGGDGIGVGSSITIYGIYDSTATGA